jgi:hypothetical protein
MVTIKRNRHSGAKPTTLQLSASQMVICLLRQLGGKAVVELEEVAALGKDVRIDMKQNGNSMHLSVVEVEVEEQGVILTPGNNNLILRG